MDEPEGNVNVILEPLDSVNVCTFETDLERDVGLNVKVEPFVIRVVRPVIDDRDGRVTVIRPWPDAVRVSVLNPVFGAGVAGEVVGQLFLVGWIVYEAHPIVLVPDMVSGRRGTFVPPQLQ